MGDTIFSAARQADKLLACYGFFQVTTSSPSGRLETQVELSALDTKLDPVEEVDSFTVVQKE